MWDPAEYKEFTRETWDYAAPAYLPFARRYLEPYGQALLKLLKIPKNSRVLDIASGAGEPAITLAKHMGPTVSVTGCDTSEEMVALANREAKRRRAYNVQFQVEDAEHLSFKSNSFDVVTCRFGLQIFTDPDRALDEMRRVMKPGAQVGIAVWGLSWRADFIDIFIGAIIRNTAQPEYIPTPYEFGNIKELQHALEKAGFRDVRDSRVTLNLTTDSPLQYWDAFRRATPMGPVLTYHPRGHVRKVKADIFRRLQTYPRRRGKIIVPCEAVLAVARK